MFRYFNEGLPLPQDLAATLPEAVIAPLGGSTLQDPYLQKLCCELLDLGKYELCCRYFEGAPAGAQLLSAQPPQITPLCCLCRHCSRDASPFGQEAQVQQRLFSS